MDLLVVIGSHLSLTHFFDFFDMVCSNSAPVDPCRDLKITQIVVEYRIGDVM
jgi:hypothetical protein